MKFTIYVPEGVQDSDQLKETTKGHLPGSDITTTETTISINWRTLDDPAEETNQIQHESLSQLEREVQSEVDPQELLSQVSADSTECDVCESSEGPFIVVEVSNGKAPTRWFAVCSDVCLEDTLYRGCLAHYHNSRRKRL